MRRFAQLFAELDASTATTAKVDALAHYFAQAQPADAAWATYFLCGGKPRAVAGSRALREFALAASGLPDWLFEECYQAVGDLAETIAHLLPPPGRSSDLGLAEWIEQRLLPLRSLPPDAVLARLTGYADELDAAGRFLLIKLIGGGFRVGVSRLLVTRALARVAGLDAKEIAQRLVGYTDATQLPDAARYRALIAPLADAGAEAGANAAAARGGTPYPFFLAQSLAAPLEQFDALLGPPSDWQIEWKYDGIRAQLVRRAGCCWLWSRGEELISESFPDIVRLGALLPEGTVLDGELLVWDAAAAQPAPFARLQTRIARKRLTPRLLQEAPAVLIAYDLLEIDGTDLRAEPLHARRARLQALHGALAADAQAAALRLSPCVSADDWTALAALRERSRARRVEGLMLKARSARYGVGRTREAGLWWKWKIDPMQVDAVLVYAQRGHGRRASLYTDYTFAVWGRAPADAAEAQRAIDAIAAGANAAALQAQGLPALVPVAKAYSGLTDAEIAQVDAVIRKTTLDKFGPVRTVRPTLVFTLGFEGVQHSARHKSGVALRFPRMLHWRHDKPLAEADTLAALQALAQVPEPGPARSADAAVPAPECNDADLRR